MIILSSNMKPNSIMPVVGDYGNERKKVVVDFSRNEFDNCIDDGGVEPKL